MISIKPEDIERFSEQYQKDSKNQEIEARIKKKGLEEACLNQKILEENEFSFNIELPETRRYDQKESLRCWIFAGINMIKRNMAQNLNISDLELELSDNYIAFFDKLEKSNDVYEKAIQTKTEDIGKFIKKLDNCVTECGNYMTFLTILEKYGIIPQSAMKSGVESKNADRITLLYREKVKKDIFELFEEKKVKSKKELREKKKQYLQENYTFLAKILGEPPTKFQYSYENKAGKEVVLKNMTPLEFKKQFLNMQMQDYIYLENCKGWEYGQTRIDTTVENVYGKSSAKLLNMPIEELKRTTMEQLKEGIPVYMGINMLRDRKLDSGVLDTRLYNYDQMLGRKRLTKYEGIKMKERTLHHWMTITGVYLENGKAKRWKVENSYGANEGINGYLIMNDNYFEEYVMQVVINKKYLKSKDLDIMNKKEKQNLMYYTKETTK